jgi:hypothetical protein
MQYLLLIGAILWFAFIAPLKVTLATCLFVLVMLSIVRFSAQTVTGVQATFGEAAKAIGLSLVFLVIAILAWVSLSFGVPKGMSVQISGLGGYAVFGSTLAAYVFGFKLGLGISFGSSAVIALISSAASTVAFMLIRGLF